MPGSMISICVLLLPLFVVGESPKRPYYHEWKPWGTDGRQGNKISIQAWWEYGCARKESELGQLEIDTGTCKNYRKKFHSLMFDLPIRPDHPGRNDETLWNCTLNVYEGDHCSGAKLATYTDANKTLPDDWNCLRAYSPSDADREARSLMVNCNGETGKDLAIVKPFCQDPRTDPEGHKGINGKGTNLNFQHHAHGPEDRAHWRDRGSLFLFELDVQCKVEPYLDLKYNTSDYWNAKRHHDADPYWFLKMHELGHLTGCDMWTSVMSYGLCQTPGTIVDQCGLNKPAWPAWLPWRADKNKGSWLPPEVKKAVKYPPWPNDGYKACLSAYDAAQSVTSSYMSWSGPPYYSTHYASTYEWTSVTALVSGTTRTRMYPYMRPTVTTIWDRVDTNTWPKSWPKGLSTWSMQPTDATIKLSLAPNTLTRPPVKTRFSTITVAAPSTTTMTAAFVDDALQTLPNGETVLLPQTSTHTMTIAGDRVIGDPAQTSVRPSTWLTYLEASPTGEHRSDYPSFSELWLTEQTSTKTSLWEPMWTRYSTVRVPPPEV